jgi:S-adenosylmethionine decarboxylase
MEEKRTHPVRGKSQNQPEMKSPWPDLEFKNPDERVGMHVILDFFGARRLDDSRYIEALLRQCVDAAGASLLHLYIHCFTPTGGVSGVAVLAESHISVHSWPERGYVALDVFMCGQANYARVVEILRDAFRPREVKITHVVRGCGSAWEDQRDVG